ncbi:probable disease resistance protein RF9 [Phoenix dactylifera]|uniref:Probable disease resistance protein RF9 n=1 Tax=Phoenix dactylifera TaxID=42345 RepID=A0A8B9A037_PHODC|nr:probable disease resistance protein RF9 [Phoenix dactylifera]
MKTFLITLPIIGDYNNLQTLRIRMLGDFLAFRDPALFSITQLRLAWLGELSGKAPVKMDSLNSVTLVLRFQITGDVLFAQAPNLHQLHSLTLWGRLSLETLKPQQQLPDSSQFPPNLTKLILWNSKLEQDPMPVLEKLPNLRFLQLNAFAYVGKSMSCSSAGGFPRLQHLILFFLHNLREWRVEAGAMPSLTHLTINRCRMLKMLPEGLQHMTTLIHLTINYCDKLEMLPERLQQVTTLRRLKLSLMPRELNNRVRNTVRHIPSIIFEHELQEEMLSIYG